MRVNGTWACAWVTVDRLTFILGVPALGVRSVPNISISMTVKVVTQQALQGTVIRLPQTRSRAAGRALW
jgi:hypothetical protein